MKQHLQKIDILRAIAILMVFIYHSQISLFPDSQVTDYKYNGVINASGIKSLILNFSPSAFGWVGVFLFLIISGFLIHLGYLKNESNFNLRSFYSKRFWRIYPPYWFTLIFFSFTTGGFWLYFFYKSGFENFILHFFTLHNLSDSTYFGINGSFWSLALEAQLYLIYPVLLYLRRRTGMKNTFMLVLLLSVVLLLIGIKFNNFGSVLAYPHSVFILWFVWVAGAYLAEIYFQGKTLFKRGGFWVALFLFLLLISSRYFIFTNYLSSYIATFSCIVFFDWFLNKSRIKMSSWLSKIMTTIGLCSYSIYLIHQPFLTYMVNFFDIISNKHFIKVLNVVPVFIIIFLISWSLYQFIELPSIAFGNKLRKRKGNE